MATAARSLLGEPWAIPLDPARRDGRIVAESAEAQRRSRRVALPSSLHPGLAEALRGAGVERLYSHQRARAAGGGGLRPDHHQRHRLGQVARLQPAGAGRHRARPEAPRPLPLPDQGAGPGPGAKARAAAAARPARGDLRRRHAARGAPRDPPPQQPRPHQPRHAPRRPPAAPPPVGGLPHQPRLGRRRRGPHLPRSLRLPRGQRAAAAAARGPRLRVGAALHPRLGDDRQPRGAGRAPGRHQLRADRRRRRAALGPRDRDVEPAADRRGLGRPPLASGGGGGPARRPRLPGGAHDLLPAQPPRDRADPALRP